ncbi:hypothetical protein AGLY_012305 [Aphis glycines]|uniref:Uncharacterized protein n=1 Tax=Aphis glycines TaxID=307491 RepID=A0A6G0T9Q1_APHGL|nr:hypothetical protein AGLY_012305 [Aphis glycines]
MSTAAVTMSSAEDMVSDSDSYYGTDDLFTVDEIFHYLNEVGGRNSVIKNNLHVKAKNNNKNKINNIINNDNNILLSNNSVEPQTSNKMISSDDSNLENLDILYLENGILKEFNDLTNINLSNTEVPIFEENPPADEMHIDNNPINIESYNVLRERKKVAKPETWTRGKAQMNRMRGESYVGFRRADAKSTNKILQDVQRAARVMGPPCKSPVYKKWITRLCDSVSEDHHILFNDFWKNIIYMFLC